jgi:hypothetical protein
LAERRKTNAFTGVSNPSAVELNAAGTSVRGKKIPPEKVAKLYPLIEIRSGRPFE